VLCLERLQWGLGNCESVRQANCVETLDCRGDADFLSDAADAALPASTALCWMYNAARIWTTVTSQVALRPDRHGTSVKPSGLLPSVLLRPCGSLTADVSALISARWIIIIIIDDRPFFSHVR